jgi:hypothetical protein
VTSREVQAHGAGQGGFQKMEPSPPGICICLC